MLRNGNNVASRHPYVAVRAAKVQDVSRNELAHVGVSLDLTYDNRSGDPDPDSHEDDDDAQGSFLVSHDGKDERSNRCH